MTGQIKQTLSAMTVAVALALPVVGTLAATAPAAQAATQTQTDKYPANAYVLRVNGLACPYCAYGIEKEFSHLNGTTNTDVNIAKGVVVVHVKPGTHWSQSKIDQAVKDAGFSLQRVVHAPQGG